MRKVLCPKCGRVLFHSDRGVVEIKCPRCKYITKFEIGEESVKHTVKRE